MRSLKRLWKDYRIFKEWYVMEIKKEFKSLFQTTTSSDIYTGFFRGAIKDFKKVLTRPKYHVYYSFIFIIVAVAEVVVGSWHWFLILFALFLFTVLYIRYHWTTGEPLKYYKETYFKET